MSISLPSNVRGPLLDLTLPASEDPVEIVLRNNSTSKSLQINLPAGWDGKDLTLDWFRRTILDHTGADQSALLDPGTNDLWLAQAPLTPGANDIEVEAAIIDTVERAAGEVVEDAAIGTVAWASPSNAKSSDNVYASSGLMGTAAVTRYLRATSFGFSLPAGSLVDEVFFAIEGKRVGGVRFSTVRLVKGGAIQATNLATGGPADNLGAADSIFSFGGAPSAWGTTVDQSALEAVNFGVVVSVTALETNSSASIDQIKAIAKVRPKVAYGAIANLRWERGYY